MATLPRPMFLNDDPRPSIARHSLSIFAELEIVRDDHLKWLRSYGDEFESYAQARVQNFKSSESRKKSPPNENKVKAPKHVSKPSIHSVKSTKKSTSNEKKPKKSVRSPLTPLKSHATDGDWTRVINTNAYKSPPNTRSPSTRVNDKQEFSIKDVHVEETKSDSKEEVSIPTRETSLRNTPAQKVGQKQLFPTTQSKTNAASVFASSRTPAVPPRHVNLPPSPSSHFLPKNHNRTSALGSVGLGSNAGKVSISGNTSSNAVFGSSRRTLGRLDSDFGLRQNNNTNWLTNQAGNHGRSDDSHTTGNNFGEDDSSQIGTNHSEDIINPIEALKHKVESMRGVSIHANGSRQKSTGDENNQSKQDVDMETQSNQMESNEFLVKEKAGQKEYQPKRSEDNLRQKRGSEIDEVQSKQPSEATQISVHEDDHVREDIQTQEDQTMQEDIHTQEDPQIQDRDIRAQGDHVQEDSHSKDMEDFKTPEQEELPEASSEHLVSEELSYTPPGEPNKTFWRNHFALKAKKEQESKKADEVASLGDDGRFENAQGSRIESTPQKERHQFIPSKSGLPKSSSASSISMATKSGSVRSTTNLSPTKKAKMDVKNIQLAAAAAKREKEEQERKLALKEQKRLAIQQKKTEILANEHNSKKRKEPLSRSLNAQTASSAAKVKIAKLTPKASYRPNTAQGSSSQTNNQTNSTRSIPRPATLKNSLAQSQSTQSIQSIHTTTQVHPDSESFELPHINSEYSDSDSEEKKKKDAELPTWAQSPNLHDALMAQSHINPDNLFGAIQPLRMEEIFRGGRSARFRTRTSSANWVHTGDGLTREEEVEYARRMGYTDDN